MKLLFISLLLLLGLTSQAQRRHKNKPVRPIPCDSLTHYYPAIISEQWKKDVGGIKGDRLTAHLNFRGYSKTCIREVLGKPDIMYGNSDGYILSSGQAAKTPYYMDLILHYNEEGLVYGQTGSIE